MGNHETQGNNPNKGLNKAQETVDKTMEGGKVGKHIDEDRAKGLVEKGNGANSTDYEGVKMFNEPPTPEENTEKKEQSILEKLAGILEKGVIQDTEPVDIEVGNTVYQSIDNHNPEIDTSVDHAQELHEILKKHKELAIAGGLTENQSAPNDPAETKKLLAIVSEIYDKNKDEINEKLGIRDINHLTPSQATKLAALVTMTKLDYNHSQFITPSNASIYFDGLPESEKNQFRKEYYSSEKANALLNYKNHFDKEKGVTNINYKSIFNETTSEDISKKSLDEIKKMAEKEAKSQVEMELGRNISENDLNNIGNTLEEEQYSKFTENSKLRNEGVKIDGKRVSEMLDGGKGICRNYAMANEAIFEALKTAQEPDNNQLKNSILSYYQGNTLDEKNIGSLLADKEDGTNQHAWNELITIGKDGKQYVSQIDSTHADTGGHEGGKTDKNSDLSKVDTLDKTFDRLFNDIADHSNNSDFPKMGLKMESLLLKMKESGDTKGTEIINKKIYDYYNKLGDTVRVKEIEDKIKNSDFVIGDGRQEICSSKIDEKKYDEAMELVGKNALENDGSILLTSVINFNKDKESGNFDSTSKIFEIYLERNPDFLQLDENGKIDNLTEKLPNFPGNIKRLVHMLEKNYPDKFIKV